MTDKAMTILEAIERIDKEFAGMGNASRFELIRELNLARLSPATSVGNQILCLVLNLLLASVEPFKPF